MINDTCVAFATPVGQAGLAVLRLSGSKASNIADRIFCPGRWREVDRSAFLYSDYVSKMAGYTCRFGHVFSPDDFTLIDQAVLTKFVAPHSYTGEDVVEISVHGGLAVRNRLLNAAISAGARMAEAGEFTKRAFLSGKLDLAQAEAVMDLINADAEVQATAAMNQLEGKLSKYISRVRAPLLTAMAQLELAIQYPEHEESFVSQADLQGLLDQACKELANLVSSYADGRIIRDGLTILLAGRPNAGKSTLMNMLSGYNRAIVTDIPGTTRDTLEVKIELQGYAVTLIDTAGLRESDDTIERMGVERSFKAMDTADLILWFFPADSLDWQEDCQELLRYQGTAKILPLISKTDLWSDPDKEDRIARLINILQSARPAKEFRSPVLIAQEQPELLNTLIDEIMNIYQGIDKLQSAGEMLTSKRHLAIAKRALVVAKDLQTNLLNLPLDIVSLSLQNLAEILAEITGEVVSDEVWQTVFAKFCVGK